MQPTFEALNLALPSKQGLISRYRSPRTDTSCGLAPLPLLMAAMLDYDSETGRFYLTLYDSVQVMRNEHKQHSPHAKNIVFLIYRYMDDRNYTRQQLAEDALEKLYPPAAGRECLGVFQIFKSEENK